MAFSEQRKVVSLLVDNQAGVLTRISSLFTRRGFNIDSLTVSATNDPTISRITVTVYGDSRKLDKVAANVANRAELQEIANIYKAKIIDLSPDSMIFELTGKPEKIDAFLRMFEGYSILEQCRTGVTALERGGMHQHMQKPPQEVRAAQFPLPGTSCPK